MLEKLPNVGSQIIRLIFLRNHTSGLRLMILLLVSVSLMTWSYRHPLISRQWRQYVSLMITPVIYLIHMPFDYCQKLSESLQTRANLLNNNIALRAKVMLLQGQLQKFQSLQLENEKLRQLLKYSAVSQRLRLTLAQVIAIQASPFNHEVMINQGSNQHVFVGQAVLDAHGILGQVIDVMPYYARVLLLTDTRSGISVQNSRTNQYGILVGQGNTGLLSFLNAPLTMDIKKGDVLFSAGLGKHYPVGYPVGVVRRIDKNTTEQFLNIQVAPSANINSTTLVLLVWVDKK